MFAYFSKSLSRKVATIIGLSSLLVVLLGLTIMMSLFRSDVREHARNSLQLLTETLLTAFSVYDAKNGHPVKSLFGEMEALVEIDRVRIFDHQGKIVWSRAEDEVGQPIEKPLWRAYRKGLHTFHQGKTSNRLGIVRQIRARTSCVACHSKNRKVAAGDLIGGIHLEIIHAKLTSRLASYAQIQVLTALLLVAFVVVVTILTMRIFIASPLQKLTKAIGSAEEGNFLHRVEIKSPDEVGRLAHDFNNLLACLTEMQASQITSEIELDMAQRELKLKKELEDKNKIIEDTNHSLKQRLNELALLFDIAQALTSTLDLEHLLELLNELLGITLKFHNFSILLMNDKRTQLEVRYLFGRPFVQQNMPRFVVGTAVDPMTGLIGTVVRTGRHVMVADLTQLERVGVIEQTLPLDGSFLCIPIRHMDNLLGVLNFTRLEKNAFTEQEIRFLTSVGQQASLAFLNAQLYQEKLELSVTDDLTKVANRRRMNNHLDLEWNRAKRFESHLSVLMIDIDHFKRYNDVNGHLLGDQVLTDVAQVLMNNTRKVDTVARFGGEEFVIILPGQDKNTAESIATKLREAVYDTEFPREESQPGGHLAISIGAATFPDDADKPKQLLDLADLALYVAKRLGRNRVASFEEGMKNIEGEHQAAKAKHKTRKRRRKRKPIANKQAQRLRNRSDSPQ